MMNECYFVSLIISFPAIFWIIGNQYIFFIHFQRRDPVWLLDIVKQFAQTCDGFGNLSQYTSRELKYIYVIGFV